MKFVDFINFQVEWWLFDLGDCMLTRELKKIWYYPSIEIC
jgi:hypothetical protein